MKFEAEGQEFAKMLTSLEQFIQKVKGQNNCWYVTESFFTCSWRFLIPKGPSIKYVSSDGEGGGQNLPILLSKKLTNGEGGGHKIQKMGRRRSWMALNKSDQLEFKLEKIIGI